MGIPKKALRESQLHCLTAGAAFKDGSHQIYRATFIESGVTKSAFYKKIDSAQHYPELLALISVATSAFKRLFQGTHSAEERLVFDDNDKLVGTLSIAIDGFKPFNFLEEPIPTDPALKELAIPSTKTLIEKNFMSILLGRYFFDDDDAHPHNVGFSGSHSVDIDFDMCWYWFTIYMKEARPVIGVPKQRVSFTLKDWENFPIIKDAKPYHWPAYNRPGQETLFTGLPDAALQQVLPKAYADPTQFQRLASSLDAQTQKLASALKLLLTYQPQVIRTRLAELFGDMPLNYTSLGPELSAKYQKEFPLICNTDTNVEPFVDFIMKLYQEHYDSFYRLVVFYPGCTNNGYGVPLPTMSTALYNKPSLYKDIEKWVEVQNTTLYSGESPAVRYKTDELQQRYHQIWRDAYAPSLRTLLYDAFALTNKLLDMVSARIEPSFVKVAPQIQGKQTTDVTLTKAWELFGTMPELVKEKIIPYIAVDQDSNLRTGLLSLVDFTNEFYTIAKAYYEKERAQLTGDDNLTFVKAIGVLYDRYNLPIRQNLANTSTFANDFAAIACALKQFGDQANFALHLTTTDEQMNAPITGIAALESLPHTDPKVIAQFIDSLFLWAKNTKPEEFTRLINLIVDQYYTPYFTTLSYRQRTIPVKTYLEGSHNVSGDHRLAHILRSGNETGALNTTLITQLASKVTPIPPCIKNAIMSQTFRADLFTKAAVNFASTNERFIHIYHKADVELFYITLFDWVDALPRPDFDGIVNSALQDYENQLQLWSHSRKAEVKGYCLNPGQAKALAVTFYKGRVTSSLNDILFQKVVGAIQKAVEKNVEKQAEPGYKLISHYVKEQHWELFSKHMKECAAVASHRQQEMELSATVTRNPAGVV